MLQELNKNLLKISLSLFVAGAFFIEGAHATAPKMSKKKIESYQRLSNMSINIIGKYRKHDKKYVYLTVKKAKKLVKIPRKYFLNSPKSMSRGRKVSVTLPIGRYLVDNRKNRK